MSTAQAYPQEHPSNSPLSPSEDSNQAPHKGQFLRNRKLNQDSPCKPSAADMAYHQLHLSHNPLQGNLLMLCPICRNKGYNRLQDSHRTEYNRYKELSRILSSTNSLA